MRAAPRGAARHLHLLEPPELRGRQVALRPDEWLDPVPEKLRGRLAEIVAITDRFWDGHLDGEFKRLCRGMALVLCLEGCPVMKGKAARGRFPTG